MLKYSGALIALGVVAYKTNELLNFQKNLHRYPTAVATRCNDK